VRGGGVLPGLRGIIVLWAGAFHALSVEREQALLDAFSVGISRTGEVARAIEQAAKTQSRRALLTSLAVVHAERAAARVAIAAFLSQTQPELMS